MNSPAQLFSSESLARVTAMAQLQDRFNRILFPDWEERRLAWPRAVWMECAEMMERVHWKWWKASHAPEDLAQQRIELVDIWHFILSDALQAGRTPEEIVQCRRGTKTDPGCGGESDPPGWAESLVQICG
jgi:hypothetical protein